MSDKVEGEEVASHPVVESGVAEDEFPLFSRGDLRCSLESLEGFLP